MASIPDCKVGSMLGAKYGEWFVATSPSVFVLPPKFQYVCEMLCYDLRIEKSSHAFVSFIGTLSEPK
jgi:hypothetical protein